MNMKKFSLGICMVACLLLAPILAGCTETPLPPNEMAGTYIYKTGSTVGYSFTGDTKNKICQTAFITQEQLNNISLVISPNNLLSLEYAGAFTLYLLPNQTYGFSWLDQSNGTFQITKTIYEHTRDFKPSIGDKPLTYTGKWNLLTKTIILTLSYGNGNGDTSTYQLELVKQ
jgi:hypothetical protein